ncbi:MAG TPA: DUF2085 domain-containing protein [Polyangia bacterium]|jgi:hypothetical protein
MPGAPVRDRLARLRAGVPRGARIGVAGLALALALVTFGPALGRGAGLAAPGWERLTAAACRPFCHQLPRRSLAVDGHALPLCARCTGMWLGILAGAAAGAFWAPRRRYLGGLGLAALAFAASWGEAAREAAQRVSWPWARLGLGFVLFAGLVLAVAGDALALLAGWRRRPPP